MAKGVGVQCDLREHINVYRILKRSVVTETVSAFLQIVLQIKVFLKLWKRNQINMRAAALTYNFILSIVPALAVCLAILSFFLDIHSLSVELKLFLLKNLTTGTGNVVTQYIDGFLRNLRFRTIGYIGFGALLFTSVLLLSNIEDAMNRIWSIDKSKKLWQRIAIYNLMIFIGPFCLAISLAAKTLANKYFPHLLMQANTGTIVIMTGLFAFFYKVMPNTKVRWDGALFCGFLMALASECAKLIYAKYTAKVLFYNQVYGGLAALPLLLIWIYLNWIIFLAGTQFNFFLQNRRALIEKHQEHV